jgi:hypothetical protein
VDIQLLPVDNRSRGIELDCQILENLAGCQPRLRANEFFPPLAYIMDAHRRKRITLFVESVPWWAVLLPRKRSWVIWNHEILGTYVGLLLVSTVICKTRTAEKILERISLPARREYVGFTSTLAEKPTFPAPAAAQPLVAVLHLGGQSTYKQTPQVLEAWLEHPEFPRLVVTCFGKLLASLPKALLKQARSAGNIELWEEPVTRSEVDRWLREIPIHLCPSAAEGFGHSLNESRFHGALVISTDAEPMRSFANVTVQPQKRGLFARVTAEAVAGAVEQALQLSQAQRVRLGRQNQRDFERDHRAFQRSFQNLRNALEPKDRSVAPGDVPAKRLNGAGAETLRFPAGAK